MRLLQVLGRARGPRRPHHLRPLLPRVGVHHRLAPLPPPPRLRPPPRHFGRFRGWTIRRGSHRGAPIWGHTAIQGFFSVDNGSFAVPSYALFYWCFPKKCFGIWRVVASLRCWNRAVASGAAELPGCSAGAFAQNAASRSHHHHHHHHQQQQHDHAVISQAQSSGGGSAGSNMYFYEHQQHAISSLSSWGGSDATILAGDDDENIAP